MNRASFGSDPDGARTHDPNIKSVVLYQLSYGISLSFPKKVRKDNSILVKANAISQVFMYYHIQLAL